jgi:hypothetical protein
MLWSRVARWFIFKPKMPIWVNLVGSFKGRCWYILCPFGLSYGHLVFLCPFLCILGSFWYFVLFWYAVSRKIWQPCCGGTIKLIVTVSRSSFHLGCSVTRLGEFSRIGRLFTLGSFLKITEVSPYFGLPFSALYFGKKRVLGYFS